LPPLTLNQAEAAAAAAGAASRSKPPPSPVVVLGGAPGPSAAARRVALAEALAGLLPPGLVSEPPLITDRKPPKGGAVDAASAGGLSFVSGKELSKMAAEGLLALQWPASDGSNVAVTHEALAGLVAAGKVGGCLDHSCGAVLEHTATHSIDLVAASCAYHFLLQAFYWCRGGVGIFEIEKCPQ
jgi:hypothetical protein